MAASQSAGAFRGLPETLAFIERDWLSSNLVLARGTGGNVLIDSGYGTRRTMTLALVDRSLAGAPLHRIINTHTHSDHVGGNAALKARHGCRIAVPAGSFDAIRTWDHAAMHFVRMGQVCDRFDADDAIADGDRIEFGDLDWQVLGSPGHDMDSLLLYQARHGILISADALWENGFGIVFPEFDGEPGFAAQADTLARLGALDVAVVIPGHGRMFVDFAAALARARDRLAHFRTHPERHAWLALKVTLSFLLLDRRRMSLRDLATTFGELPLIRTIDRRFFGGDASRLTRDVVDSLLSSGAARIQDGWLLSAG